METYPVREIENKLLHGRHNPAEPECLFWAGSALELCVTGSELHITAQADYNMYEPWLAVYIDDAFIFRFRLLKGQNDYLIFRGMNGSTQKKLRIVRDTQPFFEMRNFVRVTEIITNGELRPVSARKNKLEFIGDSITSGEGTIGAQCSGDFITMVMSQSRGYAAQLSQSLNADYQLYSQSGWGIASAWDNNPFNNMTDYYEQTCGVVRDDYSVSLGSMLPNDFSAFVPDCVIINLGTNDSTAMKMQPFKANGKEYKQTAEQFPERVMNFIRLVRKNRPDSYIIWALGILFTEATEMIPPVIEEYIKQTGDRKIEFMKLPQVTSETLGSRGHPGVNAHALAATALRERIEQLGLCR